MVHYPHVIDENTTLSGVLYGKSIARFGDGEFKLCLGRDCISQVADPQLKDELRHILMHPTKDCLVGIPDVIRSPKEHWRNFNSPTYTIMMRQDLDYYSSFITRPDNAPWIDTPDYWDKIEELWFERDVVLVKGSERSLREDLMQSANSIKVIETPRRDAYADIDGIERACLEHPDRLILLCVGAAATCLAYRLSQKGRWAVDIGHIGMFMRHKGEYNEACQ